MGIRFPLEIYQKKHVIASQSSDWRGNDRYVDGDCHGCYRTLAMTEGRRGLPRVLAHPRNDRGNW